MLVADQLSLDTEQDTVNEEIHCLTRQHSHQSHCSLQEARGAFRPLSDSDPLEEADVEGWVPSCVGVSWGHWEGGEGEASDFAVGSPLRCAGSRPCVGVEIQQGTCKRWLLLQERELLTTNFRP